MLGNASYTHVWVNFNAQKYQNLREYDKQHTPITLSAWEMDSGHGYGSLRWATPSTCFALPLVPSHRGTRRRGETRQCHGLSGGAGAEAAFLFLSYLVCGVYPVLSDCIGLAHRSALSAPSEPYRQRLQQHSTKQLHECGRLQLFTCMAGYTWHLQFPESEKGPITLHQIYFQSLNFGVNEALRGLH